MKLITKKDVKGGVMEGFSILILMTIFIIYMYKKISKGSLATEPEKRLETARDSHSFTNAIGMSFKRIPAGTFMMGSPENEAGRQENETQHQVILTKPFYLQTTAVTRGQWRSIMGSSSLQTNESYDSHPVTDVSWDECQAFIKKLNTKEGVNKYRLPTEAEWEYACRAGTTGPYYADLNQAGWYAMNMEHTSHPVAQKIPNAWGLYDMHGNVAEWCQDYRGDYPKASITDPKGPLSGFGRVLRGGSSTLEAECCRSAYRDSFDPHLCNYDLGFRLAADL